MTTMRFIKRFIFLLVILLVAFFVYRLINPIGAKALVSDLKSFANDTLGTHFVLTGEVLIPASGTLLDMTGTIVQETGMLQEFATGDELLLGDIDSSTGEIISTTSGTLISTGSSGSTTLPTTTNTPSPTTSSSTSTPKKPSSSKGLSTQELRDLKNFLGNFGN